MVISLVSLLGTTTGVLAQHCQRTGDDANTASELKKAWQDSIFGKCDLQVFIDIDNQGSVGDLHAQRTLASRLHSCTL